MGKKWAEKRYFSNRWKNFGSFKKYRCEKPDNYMGHEQNQQDVEKAQVFK